MARKVSLILDSDSQYFACRNLIPHFINAGWTVTFVIQGDFPVPSSDPIEWIRIADIEALGSRDDVMGSDAIGAYLPGSKLRSLWLLVERHFSRHGVRPLIFAGYNGVLLQRFEDGMSWRFGFDVIPLNSPEDHESASAFSRHSTLLRPTRMPVVGINRTGRDFAERPGLDESWYRTRQVVFAEQVLFPKSPDEKFRLYSQLIRIGLENPDWRIVIKPRTMPGGHTFHRQSEHISSFLAGRFRLPANVVVGYDPLDQVLPDSTVLLSISSTAFFDAVGLGVPSYTLSDFGINTTYGTQYFHGSGCTLCLADIGKLSHDLFTARPTKEWLELKGFSELFSPCMIVADLEELLGGGCHRLPPIPYEAEQRLQPPAADLPAGCVIPQRYSLARNAQRFYRFVSRRLSGSHRGGKQDPSS